MKNTDLHTHSHYSDGQISPAQLVRLAKNRKIKNLALTDHNSVKGVNEAIAEGKKIGVNVIPAVEIKCDKGEVLGYFIDIKNKNLINYMKKESWKIQESVKNWCNQMSLAGYKISFKKILEKYPKAKGNINVFHLLYELFVNGYGKTRKIADELESKNLFREKIRELQIVKAVSLIKKAGGVPVLAHPWLNDEVLKKQNIEKYIRVGLKGIEINNGDRAPFRPTKTYHKIKKLAKKYNLIITSGSDYHGANLVKHMPGNHDLGANNCDEKVVEQLKILSTLQ